MSIFYEPVNINQWNLFEKVPGIGHVEPFLATRSMKLGDIVLLHVGSQNKEYQSGIYAFGTVIKGPYILHDHPDDYCNEKNTVDVSIDYICHGEPLFSHSEASGFIHQFRTVHRIEDRYYQFIQKRCDDYKSSFCDQLVSMKADASAVKNLLDKSSILESAKDTAEQKPVKSKKKPKKEETLDEFTKIWILHANGFDTDFEGFLSTFDDFKKSIRHSSHWNHVSDLKLQNAWNKAIREMQKEKTLRNTQEIPMEGEKPKGITTEQLRPVFKSETTIIADKIEVFPYENNTATREDSEFPVGAKVRHKMFGKGEIIKCNKNIIEVRFDSGHIKKLSIEVALGKHVIELLDT